MSFQPCSSVYDYLWDIANTSEDACIHLEAVMILEAIRTAPGRFMTNIRNPKMRKNVAILMVGKMLGLAVVLLLMNLFMPTTATRAQDVATAVDGAQINAINTTW